jgi:hypothetical protein
VDWCYVDATRKFGQFQDQFAGKRSKQESYEGNAVDNRRSNMDIGSGNSRLRPCKPKFPLLIFLSARVSNGAMMLVSVI